MRHCIRWAAALGIPLWSTSSVRADGLGPRGLEELAGIGLSVVVGGLALSVAAIMSGFLLVRGRRHHPWPAGAWGRIGYLALTGVLVLALGPILTFQFGLLTALICGGVILPFVVILLVVSAARQRKRLKCRGPDDELASQDSHVPDKRS